MIRAGKMDRIIRILSPVISVVATYTAGEQQEINSNTAWAVVATGVYANVEDQGGSEAENSDLLKSERTAMFTIRFTSLVTEAHYIDYNSGIWRIEALEEIGRKEALRIKATRIRY